MAGNKSTKLCWSELLKICTLWCCYITVDSAMAASQNGFCSYKLSIHKKTIIMQILTKNIANFICLIFYHRKIVKIDHFIYDTFLDLCKHRSV